jgi:NAD(P)-dependent dehydrogenase (short-subunit alcohol dehydrogenase family)
VIEEEVKEVLMRPLGEQVALVTGATDGLGRAAAGELASAGARVLLHGRDPERGRQALDGPHVSTLHERLYTSRRVRSTR